MNLIIPAAFLFGFTQGFVIGPVSIFGIKEGLGNKHGFWFQMQVILASCLVDVVYLFAATLGVATFIQYSAVKLIMWTAASYMLIHMGINTLRESKSKISFQHIHRTKMKFYETDFWKAFLMCLVNPMSIVFCVMVVGSLYAAYPGHVNPFVFAINVDSGGLTAATIVAIATLLIKRVFHPWMLRRVIALGALVLFFYGIDFAMKAFAELQPMINGMASVLKF